MRHNICNNGNNKIDCVINNKNDTKTKLIWKREKRQI